MQTSPIDNVIPEPTFPPPLKHRPSRDNILFYKQNYDDKAMVNWQVTATTIYCDAIDDEATILVYRDFSVKCTGYDRYGTPEPEKPDMQRNKSEQSLKSLNCEGPVCWRVSQYRDRIMSEEAEPHGE